MQVYKFGGASVKDPESIKNVARIIHEFAQKPLLVVISAMAKTTNALEQLTSLYIEGRKEQMFVLFNEIRQFHFDIVRQLFPGQRPAISDVLDQTFLHLQRYIEEKPGTSYNFEYDRIVSTGEMASTQIVSAYLHHCGIDHQWYSAPKLIITDGNFRDAHVDWILTEQAVKKGLGPYLRPAKDSGKPPIILTQGFLGGTSQGFTTTLGREGSDYSAAILAYAMNASEVVIWKDVPGLLNADPKLIDQTLMLPNISYQEAIELAYYGATVIHPKTLKPLLSKNIPLRVKSFFNPEDAGTIINENHLNDNLVSSYIFKFNQVLVSIFPKDFSFIAEQNLSRIFSEFARHEVKINLMQNSAISFSVCFDHDKIKTPALLRSLEKNFNVKYNDNLELVTIRHYEKAGVESIISGKEVVLEQKSRTTLQMVVNPRKVLS
ncbi:MAG: aspartate kinase [Bacteroidales bacterium]